MKVQLDSEFPNFVNYLDRDFREIGHVPAIIAAFNRYVGGSAGDELWFDLYYGRPPLVTIERNDSSIFESGAATEDEIIFPAWLARDFEEGKDIVKVKRGKVHRAGAVLVYLFAIWSYVKHNPSLVDVQYHAYRATRGMLADLYGPGKIHTLRFDPKNP